MSIRDDDIYSEEERKDAETARKKIELLLYSFHKIPLSGSPAPKSAVTTQSAASNQTAVSSDVSASPATQDQKLGCNVDHGQMRWATTIDLQSLKFCCVAIKEDSGTDVNWISPELVLRLGCRTHKTNSLEYLDFAGDTYEAVRGVQLTLKGVSDKTHSLECFVAPSGFPIECISVGSTFMRESGTAQVLFFEHPPTAHIMVQKDKNKAELQEIEARRIKAEQKATELEARRMAQRDGPSSKINPTAAQQSSASKSPSKVGRQSSQQAGQAGGSRK